MRFTPWTPPRPRDGLALSASVLGPLVLYILTLPRTVVLEDDGLFLMSRPDELWPGAGKPWKRVAVGSIATKIPEQDGKKKEAHKGEPKKAL